VFQAIVKYSRFRPRRDIAARVITVATAMWIDYHVDFSAERFECLSQLGILRPSPVKSASLKVEIAKFPHDDNPVAQDSARLAVACDLINEQNSGRMFPEDM
jgi:hypothetical protein